MKNINGLWLLTEYQELCHDGVCRDLLTEEEKKMSEDGTMFLTGIIQRANIKNGNGRIYPKDILKREINIYKKLAEARRAVGELDHTDEPVVNLKNASHLITEVWWDGDDVYGKLQILNSPSGKVVQSLVKDRVKIGISSRGLGSLRDGKDGSYVEDDFQLICFDIVSEPSTKGAFLNEGKKPIELSKEQRIMFYINDLLRG